MRTSFVGVFVCILLAGCSTATVMRNTNTYDINVVRENQREQQVQRKQQIAQEQQTKLTNRPNWYTNDRIGIKESWLKAEDPNRRYRYFIGASTPSNKEKRRAGVWTRDQAVAAAEQDAMRRAALFIDNPENDLPPLLDENERPVRVNFSRQPESRTFRGFVNPETGTGLDRVSRNTSFLDPNFGTYEETRDQRVRRRFWHIRKRNVSVDHVLMLFRITEQDLVVVRDRTVNRGGMEVAARQKADDSIRLAGIKRETAILNTLVAERESFTPDEERQLRGVQIDASTQSAMTTRPYDRLLSINGSLKNLTDLQGRDADDAAWLQRNTDENVAFIRNARNQYAEFQNRITREIRDYNPAERQRALARDHEGLMREVEILRRVERQSQTVIILTMPSMPVEVRVANVNIQAATHMVSNVDFISFAANHRGINSLSRAENGLHAPVTSVSWNDAALYCNWLSGMHGLAPVYTVDDRGRVIGYDRSRNGFRLPESQEIAAMRQRGDMNVSGLSIWASSGGPFDSNRRAYSLLTGVGVTYERDAPDRNVGFRVIRNAQ
jgi:hypothetical protein